VLLQYSAMDRYDPLADLLEVAAESCDEAGQPSKAHALRNLQVVIRKEPELSRELQRRMAQLLKNEIPG
jgi:hypothetical protein